MPKPKKGGFARITFMDHVQDDDAPIEFEVIGRVLDSTEKHVTMGCWLFADPGQNRDTENTTRFCIVRDAITSITKLK